MSDDEPPFRCPRCGGRYFGREIGLNPTGPDKYVLLDYRCQNDVNGGELTLVERDEHGEYRLKPPERRPGPACGWSGPFPPTPQAPAAAGEDA